MTKDFTGEWVIQWMGYGAQCSLLRTRDLGQGTGSRKEHGSLYLIITAPGRPRKEGALNSRSTWTASWIPASLGYRVRLSKTNTHLYFLCSCALTWKPFRSWTDNCLKVGQFLRVFNCRSFSSSFKCSSRNRCSHQILSSWSYPSW